MTRQPFTHIRTHTGATPCHGNVHDTDVHSGFPHITISTADGVKPVESIQAIKDAIRDGTVMTRGEWSDIQFFGTVSDGGKVE